jgi:hypothetical protein
MNSKENNKNYIILISILAFFLISALGFVLNLLINGTSFFYLSEFADQNTIINSNKIDLVMFNKATLDSDKFRELTLSSQYQYSTSTLKIGKQEPFGDSDVK